MGSEPLLHHRLAHIHRYRYCLSAPLARSSRRSLRLPRTPYVRLIAYSSAIAYCLLPIVSAPLACICRRLIPGFWFPRTSSVPPTTTPSCIPSMYHSLVSCSRVLGISPPTVSLLLCFASGFRAFCSGVRGYYEEDNKRSCLYLRASRCVRARSEEQRTSTPRAHEDALEDSLDRKNIHTLFVIWPAPGSNLAPHSNQLN